MGKKLKYATFAIKFLVLALCVWYLGRIAVKIDPNEFRLSYIFPVCLCGFFYFICTLIISKNWQIILFELDNIKRKYAVITRIYLQTAIAKYLPSNIMHYAGRHYLGKQLGIEHKFIAAGNLLEVCLIIVSAILIICVSSWFEIIDISFGQELYNTHYNVWIVVSSLVITAVICGVVRARIIKSPTGKNLSRVIHFAMIIVNYIFFFVATGIVLFFIFWMIDYVEFQWFTILEFVAIYAGSWTIGFVTPGAPGGIGVRESVMVMLLSDKIGAENALMGALLFRFATVLGELIGFGYANYFLKNIGRDQPHEPAD